MVRADRTQADLAAHLGISQQSLSRRMSGQTPFSIDELATIATALQVSLTDLVVAA